jgi:hypothetical protein
MGLAYLVESGWRESRNDEGRSGAAISWKTLVRLHAIHMSVQGGVKVELQFRFQVLKVGFSCVKVVVARFAAQSDQAREANVEIGLLPG